MKLKYLYRDKVDLIILILSVIAVVQWFIFGHDVTPAIGIIVLYIVGVMARLGRANDYNLKQSLEIKELNIRRFENDKFINELMKKYGVTTKAQKSFSERLNESFKKKNLENGNNPPSKI